jgi:hypothetical protein
MSLDVYETVRYTRRLKNGKSERVEGLRVGRFAIRETGGVEDGNVRFSVDHISTGFRLIAVRSMQDAAMIVDDISRFSVRDPASRDRARAGEQIGKKVREWLKAQEQRVQAGDAPISYREFFIVEHAHFNVDMDYDPPEWRNPGRSFRR